MSGEMGVVCASFVAFFVLFFGFLALLRWLRHKETMAMIEQGMVPPKTTKPGRVRNGGKRSLLVWGIGIGVFGLVLLLIMGAASMLFLDSGGGTALARSMLLLVLPGLTVLFAGVALLILYFVVQPTRVDEVDAELETVSAEPESVEFEAKVK